MTPSSIHHVSSLVRDINRSFNFYHKLLGLNLLMKTVNQENNEMYHLFFTDAEGRPGTDFTIFEDQTGRENIFGTNAIERTVFLVPSEASLVFWQERLEAAGVFNCEVETYNQSKILRFDDPDGLKLGLVPLKTTNNNVFHPSIREDIPAEHSLLGIDSVHLRVRYASATGKILKDFFQFNQLRTIDSEAYPVTVYGSEMAPFSHEIHLIEDQHNHRETNGVGGVHHLALSVENYSELLEMQEKIDERNFYNSGIKNREFFNSTYFREANQILIEVATHEGAALDLPIAVDSLAEAPLHLPSFLEDRRNFIAANLVRD